MEGEEEGKESSASMTGQHQNRNRHPRLLLLLLLTQEEHLLLPLLKIKNSHTLRNRLFPHTRK